MWVPARSTAWMKAKVQAPVETCPLSAAVSAAVWLSLAAPNWMASPPRVPCVTALSEVGLGQSCARSAALSAVRAVRAVRAVSAAAVLMLHGS